MDYNFIREQRKQKKIKQYEIAQRCNISQPYYSAIEKGLKSPTVAVLENICNELDCELRIIPKA